MSHVTANDLKTHHSKRFQEEYLKWAEYAADFDWWEYTEERFKEDMDAEGVYVARIEFSLGYSQSDYAGFEGHIRLPEFMELKGYDVEYPALYLAVKQYGDSAAVGSAYRRGSGRVNWPADSINCTEPCGVFTGLDNDAWDLLVADQFYEAGLEDEMQSYVDDKCRELYRSLQDEYEHLTSEESFIEHCECNEVTFEIEGETNEVPA
jgi:hypothetical protein